MEELYVFGTGNAQATHCYNTCFAIKDGDEFFMVDAGGGNGILGILEKMNVDMAHIHHIFVTHEHTDHILGIVWMVRMIATAMKKGKYEGELRIYCHPGTCGYDFHLMPFNPSGKILQNDRGTDFPDPGRRRGNCLYFRL